MKRQGVSLPAVQTDFFVPAGGLDEITPPLQLADGACRAMQNFEQGIRGGYRRIKGYERFIGRQPTAEMKFSTLTIRQTSGGTGASIAAWDALRGQTSGATATVICAINATVETPTTPGSIRFPIDNPSGGVGFYLYDKVGEFISGEVLEVNGNDTPFGTYRYGVLSSGFDLDFLYLDQQQRAEVRDLIERNARAAMFRPGAGLQRFKSLGISEIGGVPYLAGLEYVGTACYFGMYRILGTGAYEGSVDLWQRVTPLNATTLVYSAPGFDSTNFSLGEPTYCEMVAYNFTGAAYATKIYGVLGRGTSALNANPVAAGKAFVFDGSTISFITTGMTPDRPTRIAAHKNRLFLAFGASLQYSAAGAPLTWSAVLGAGEIATGEIITQIGTVVGNDAASALLVGTKKGIFILYGDAAADYRLVTVNKDMGMFPGTMQVMADPLFMNEYGVTTLGASQSFGNFQTATISQQVQRFINKRRGLATCSVLVRGSNQYRVFFSDGSGLYFTFKGNKLAAVTPVQFNHVVRSAVTYQDFTFGEVILFVSDDGVYRMDVGRNFDGEPIDSFALMSFNHMKSPRLRKAFRRLALEIEADNGYVKFQAGVDVDYSGPDAKQSPEQPVDANSSTLWDVGNWDDLTWDAYGQSPVSMSIDGTGKNVSLFVRCNDKYFDPFTITGVMTHWVARRLER